MQFRILIFLSDFMHVPNIKKHSTKNECFPKHIPFTTISLLQKQKLNHRNYYEQEINMEKFVQVTEHNMHMHAKEGERENTPVKRHQYKA
jgi:hypothetical protein